MKHTPALFFALGAIACGCGGKLLLVEGDAGSFETVVNEASVDAAPAPGTPVVTSVSPRSGANSGGTRVVISGSGFDSNGGSVVTFNNFPASDVSCTSTTECSATTPYPGDLTTSETVDVQVTVHGALGAPNALTSGIHPPDRFTYDVGPACTPQLSCRNRTDFPALIITCPTTVTFYASKYSSPSTPSQLVATGTTYTSETNAITGVISACVGSPSNGSCSKFSMVASATACGWADFCFLCIGRKHGVCLADGHDGFTCWASGGS